MGVRSLRLDPPPQNIIVRMPNWLGDLVMATPVLADLRQHWPEAKITAMCQGSVGVVIEEDPHIDELLNFQRPSGWIHREVHGDIIEPLRHGHYDLGLLLTNSLSSAWWFWRGHVQNRVGYAAYGRSWLLDCAVPWPKNLDKQHMVVTYKKLLEPLGIPLSKTAPHLYLTEGEKFAAKRWLAKYGVNDNSILVGISPGAAYGAAKCWIPERFREISLRLIENPKVVVIFFGDKAGAPLVNDICMGLPERVVNLAGKTNLRELMALIEACDVFLGNDSGPMHMAYALDVPVLALFGPTSEVATGPYKNGLAIHKHVPCSPCHRRECPIDSRCMTQIEVDDVYRELQKLLREKF